MADENLPKGKRRGRYREYMRHFNPYKFPAARRRRKAVQKANRLPAVAGNNFNKCESDVKEVSCEQPGELHFTVNSVEHVRAETNTSPGEEFNYEQIQEMDDSSDEDDLGLSEDELLNFARDDNTYERFIKDDDACSDCFSDSEIIESDSESIPEWCEAEADEILYSGAPITSSASVVLLLSFVFKHKLTHEAFSDLLAVI